MTVAVDTDVPVRLLVADDPEQAEAARQLFERERIFVPLTVLPETFRVLRAVYRTPVTQAAEALERLSFLPNVDIEHPGRPAFALSACRAGLDFADALHLAACPEEAPFATSDRRILRRVRRIADAPTVFEPGRGPE